MGPLESLAGDWDRVAVLAVQQIRAMRGGAQSQLMLGSDENLWVVKFQNNPQHRRAKLLQLTPAGRGALKKIQAAQRPWAESLGAKIGEAELRRANDILGRVLDSLT